jgi:hypothetical protein
VQSRVPNADAALTGLSCQELDHDLDLLGTQLAEQRGKKLDLFQALAGIGDAPRSLHHAGKQHVCSIADKPVS